MSQKQVAGWLKGITLSIAGMGLLFFGLVVPYLAWDMAVTYPDYAALRIPGILYGWGIAVFCYAILYQFWKVCVQIGRDNSFSGENARSFVVISRLAFDIYDSAHFYQCGDRGACSGAVPPDLQVVRDEAGCGTDNIGRQRIVRK